MVRPPPSSSPPPRYWRPPHWPPRCSAPRLATCSPGTPAWPVDQTAPSVQALGEDYAGRPSPPADAAREACALRRGRRRWVPDPGSWPA
ncbi:hypothetical protein QJS66_07245 [Kocuria rhizophila]|nr:hypothetical protein QJS66_07245 [Kocuria rhizophila]